MKMWGPWVVLVLLVSLNSFGKPEKNDLLSVVVLFRHGDRAPDHSYARDPNENVIKNIWADGRGQLTNIGKRQHYTLGQWLRRRYNGFLSDTYNRKDIRVESSDSDRCLMSASANLAGLYLPVGDQIWNTDLPWIPIPVHTTPVQNDPFLAMQKPCLKFDTKFKKLKTEKFVVFGDENHELLAYLYEKSGNRINNFEDIIYLYDTLHVHSLYNLTLPDWTKTVFPDRLKSATAFYWGIYTETPELSRLRTGPLIDHITSHLDGATTTIPNTPKFLMLSGHDMTIINLLNSLELYANSSPQYASTLIFELRSRESGGKFINIFFKNDAYSDKLVKLSLKNCELDCEWNNFKAVVEPVRIDSEQWEKECLITPSQTDTCQA